MAEPPKILHQSPRVVIATWRDILISIWRANVEVADMKPAQRGQAELMARYPRYGNLALAEKGALRMSSEARHEAARITEAGKASTGAVALVIALEGFAGAAVRAAVTGVHILSRSKIPQKSFDQVAPAAHWLFEKMGQPLPDVAAFTNLVEDLRAIGS